jgi:hypothetical protein
LEITFVWSWFSFIVGSASTIVGSLALLFFIAFKQWKKQKEAAEKNSDSVERLFASWGGKDNGTL